MKRIIATINSYMAIVSGLLIFIISILSGYESISRTLFNMPTKWTSSLSVVMMLYAIFLGSAYCFHKDGHIRVELILDRLGPKYYRLFLFFGYLICAATLVILAWKSIQFTTRAFRLDWLTLTTIQFPLGYVSIIIPIGCILMLLAISVKVLELFRTETRR